MEMEKNDKSKKGFYYYLACFGMDNETIHDFLCSYVGGQFNLPRIVTVLHKPLPSAAQINDPSWSEFHDVPCNGSSRTDRGDKSNRCRLRAGRRSTNE